MNVHRRNLLTVVGFLAVVFLGDRIGGHVLNRLFQSSKFRFAQIYSGDLSADVVFIGNSRGLHMFHRPPLEELSGKRIANLSFNGMPATVMPAVFADYLSHHEPPQQLFIEVSCVGRKNEVGSLERFTVLVSESSTVDRIIGEHNSKVAWMTKLSYLYRFNSELFLRSMFFRNQSDQDWIMESVVDANWEQAFQDDERQKLERSQMDADAISEVMRLAAEKNVEVELVLAPYLPGYVSRLTTKSTWLKWLSDELGAPIADYSLAIKEDECFADPIHLNPQGARRLAELLVSREGLINTD